MRELIEDIRGALLDRRFFVGLMGTLSIPDIAGAIAAADGRATGRRYVEWFDTNMPVQYARQSFDGAECYAWRCGMLHQGRSQPDASRREPAYRRIIFKSPEPRVRMHLCSADDVLIIDLLFFCDDLLSAAETWLDANRGDPTVAANLREAIRLHPHGFERVIAGVTVIG